MREGKPRIVYLEILRVIAIFGVIFCHTDTAGVHHYLETSNVANYWFGIFLATVVQYCIPLFFMITGAVLLNREESIGYVYRHRVLNMVIVTILASLIQYLWLYRGYWYAMDFKGYIRLLYEGNTSVPMWFLYTYISFLMVLPFLQRLVKAIPKNSWYLYLFLGELILNHFLPILEYYTGWNGTSLEMYGLDQYVLIGIMGYFVHHKSGDMFYKKKNILILVGLSVPLTALSMHVNHDTLSFSKYVDMGQLFTPVYALVIFVLVRYVCHFWKMSPRWEKVFCFAGAGVFGTYLIEMILRDFFYPVYVVLGPKIHAYPAAFVWSAVCVLAGILLANLFKRIPIVGKLI